MLLFGTRLLLIRGTTRRTGPRGISLSASMAWDLGRTETLPFPDSRPQEPEVRHPLDGVTRSLAITGFSG